MKLLLLAITMGAASAKFDCGKAVLITPEGESSPSPMKLGCKAVTRGSACACFHGKNLKSEQGPKALTWVADEKNFARCAGNLTQGADCTTEFCKTDACKSFSKNDDASKPMFAPEGATEGMSPLLQKKVAADAKLAKCAPCVAKFRKQPYMYQPDKACMMCKNDRKCSDEQCKKNNGQQFKAISTTLRGRKLLSEAPKKSGSEVAKKAAKVIDMLVHVLKAGSEAAKKPKAKAGSEALIRVLKAGKAAGSEAFAKAAGSEAGSQKPKKF
jgi:hypothetical protein